MKGRLKPFLICLFIILLATYAIAGMNLTSLVKKIQPAVSSILTYDKDNKLLGLGSGFFIDPEGHLITNYHVLEGAHQAEVKTRDGKKYPITSVMAENKAMDLIKVSTDIPRGSIQWLNVTGTLPSITERIVVIGGPMGLAQTISEGIVSGVREIPNMGKILQILVPISPGSSGSPVVNMKGQVIGVATLSQSVVYLMKGQNLNFAIPAQDLIDMKSSGVHKTLSEWSHDASQKLVREKSQPSRLFVDTEPERARIQILNIKPKFLQGIMLNPGQYHIEVSANGYEMEKMGIKIAPGEDKILKIALKKLPRSTFIAPEELVPIGNAYFDKGEYKKAIEAYKQAIRIDPNYAVAHYNLGVAYGKHSHYNEAIEAFKQSARINPDDAAAHSSLGNAYDSLGRYNEAIQAYKQAIRIDPDYAVAHSSLGITYGSLGRLNEAIAAFKLAVRIDPDDTAAHSNLGVTYGSLGRYNEAIEAYKQAIRIDPHFADAHYNLGVTHLVLKNTGGAFEEYTILKTLDKELANKLFNGINK